MKKGLSCFLCCLPLVLYIVIMIPTVILDVGLELEVLDGSSLVMALLIILMLGSFVFVIATYGVMIWLITKTVESDEMELPLKAIWSGCLYYFNVFAFPAYWFVYIRKE